MQGFISVKRWVLMSLVNVIMGIRLVFEFQQSRVEHSPVFCFPRRVVEGKSELRQSMI